MSKFIDRREGKRNTQKEIVVFYHGNCSDGFGAAWAAWKKFGAKADYIAVQYHQFVIPNLRNKTIYLLDMTFEFPILKRLESNNKRVTAIDHHVSREKQTKSTEQFSYALYHSGAVLAWKYFHPNRPVPRMFLHIEDMDLWNLKLPFTKELYAFLDLYDFDFKLWSKFIRDFENAAGRKKIVVIGRIALLHEEKLVKRLATNNRELVKFEGHIVYAVNSPLFNSQIGAALYKKRPPMSIVWHKINDQLVISLRSDGGVNVAKIAEKYGGGGHHGASGIVLPWTGKFPWKNVRK